MCLKYDLFQTRPILRYFSHLVLLGNIDKHVTTLLSCCLMNFKLKVLQVGFFNKNLIERSAATLAAAADGDVSQ